VLLVINRSAAAIVFLTDMPSLGKKDASDFPSLSSRTIPSPFPFILPKCSYGILGRCNAVMLHQRGPTTFNIFVYFKLINCTECTQFSIRENSRNVESEVRLWMIYSL